MKQKTPKTKKKDELIKPELEKKHKSECTVTQQKI